MQKRLCEIAGKRYMSPSAAADLWQMKYQAVTTACKESRIIGACTDSAGKWIIPIDAMMPMEYNKIRELLLCTLALKNRYDENLITLSVKDVEKIYSYLFGIGCIEAPIEYSAATPQNVVLTEKGFRIATAGKQVTINWLNAGSTLIQLIASAITIWQSIG